MNKEIIVRTELRIPKELWTEVKCAAPRMDCSANEAVLRFVRQGMLEWESRAKDKAEG